MRPAHRTGMSRAHGLRAMRQNNRCTRRFAGQRPWDGMWRARTVVLLAAIAVTGCQPEEAKEASVASAVDSTVVQLGRYLAPRMTAELSGGGTTYTLRFWSAERLTGTPSWTLQTGSGSTWQQVYAGSVASYTAPIANAPLGYRVTVCVGAVCSPPSLPAIVIVTPHEGG